MTVIESIASKLESRGYKVESFVGNYRHFRDLPIGATYGFIEELYRSNGTAQDVNYRVGIERKTSEYGAYRTAQVKIPMNASERVINNRINKLFNE